MLFIETSTFTRALPQHLDYPRYASLRAFLAAHPDVGDALPDADGVRVVHWAAAAPRRGPGARVVYHWLPAEDRIHMLTLHASGTKHDLTPAERDAGPPGDSPTPERDIAAEALEGLREIRERDAGRPNLRITREEPSPRLELTPDAIRAVRLFVMAVADAIVEGKERGTGDETDEFVELVEEAPEEPAS